jgi:ribosomal protein S18 acetylase RimI-like enzyme
LHHALEVNMTVLMPLLPDAFPAFLESSVVGYAQSNLEAGRWSVEGAVERSLADFNLLLPQGLATPDHFIYEIRARALGTVVGHLWMAIETRHGLRSAFVYDLEIAPEFRRQGHARRAFLALETVVAGFGIASIGLHVFSYNVGAQALYESLGYQVTGVNMQKSLVGGAPPA